MTRSINAIDFWRGFALITIFINHMPGNAFDQYTHKNISISDSAELFVFLAGWSMRYIADGTRGPMPADQLLLRLSSRAFTLYAAHMLIVMLAIAMLAFASIWLANPLLLEWHNAAAVFANPVETHIGLVLLSHQLGYFDILPLYVVMMLLAPFIAFFDRWQPHWLLPVSLAIYFSALIFKLTIPTWPTEGQWFFNPLCWQAVYVLGFTLSRDTGLGGWVRANITRLRYLAAPIVLAGAVMVWFRWWPDATRVPEPRLLFINGKTFATPLRMVQFLSLMAIGSLFFPWIVAAVPRLVSYLSLLGRNSLQVFCAGSLLSLAGQIVRFQMQGGLFVDTVLVAGGIGLLGVIGWLAEWRDRSRGRA